MNPKQNLLFLEKIDFSRGSCWEWTGAKSGSGYGYFRVDGHMQRAHRFAYQLFIGLIPPGLFVLHHCDRPSCVNPRHLFTGTHTDNVRDSKRKGRLADQKGMNGPRAKLTNKQVIRIRRLFWGPGVSQAQLGRMFSVGHTAIWHIVRRRTWKHI